MAESVTIGPIGQELYTNFILWNDGHGRHYAYEGTIDKARVKLYPVLIDGMEKAQNRFYQMSIFYSDDRPDVNRLVKYYFVVKTCRQNHINFDSIDWQRKVVKPDTAPKPRPRKGPEKANIWFMVIFTYQNLFKPVLTRSVDRAWHSEYADSPVPIAFIGYTTYTPDLFEKFMQLIEPQRHHGNWFNMTDDIQRLLADLNFTTELA